MERAIVPDRTIIEALPLPQREVVDRLGRVFAAEGEAIYLVGGPVRDLLGRQHGFAWPLPVDLDFATSATPEATRHLGEAAGPASIFAVGERFGTIGFVFGSGAGPVHVEVTTYRAEHYPDETRFPTVRFGASLDEDLSRRDFTINAIALDIAANQLVDPFDGQADLVMSVIRTVGNPDERFAEDPLRLLRAARFVAQLGFRIDTETAEAMSRDAPALRRISQERIFAELTKMLIGPFAGHGLEALRRTGLISVAMPELAPLVGEAEVDAWDRAFREKDLWEHTLRVVEQSPPHPIVRWSALVHDAAKPLTRGFDASGDVNFIGHERVGADLAAKLLRRLKADKTTQSAVRRIVELHGRPTTYGPDWTDSAVRRLQVDAGDVLDELLDLAAADVTSASEQKRLAAAARVDGLRAHIARLNEQIAFSRLQSPLDGHELMAIFDRPPGIWIKQIKDHLRELVIDGDLAPDDKATAEQIAREMMTGEEG